MRTGRDGVPNSTWTLLLRRGSSVNTRHLPRRGDGTWCSPDQEPAPICSQDGRNLANSGGSVVPANDYHFVTHWRVQGSIDEVAAILGDAPSLQRWWPAVYLDVKEIEPPDERGV